MTGWVELIWDGKRERAFTKESVDENYGKVKDVKKFYFPVQKLEFHKFHKVELLGINKETNESLFPQENWPKNYPQNWKNLLIWGITNLPCLLYFKE